MGFVWKGKLWFLFCIQKIFIFNLIKLAGCCKKHFNWSAENKKTILCSKNDKMCRKGIEFHVAFGVIITFYYDLINIYVMRYESVIKQVIFDEI